MKNKQILEERTPLSRGSIRYMCAWFQRNIHRFSSFGWCRCARCWAVDCAIAKSLVLRKQKRANVWQTFLQKAPGFEKKRKEKEMKFSCWHWRASSHERLVTRSSAVEDMWLILTEVIVGAYWAAFERAIPTAPIDDCSVHRPLWPSGSVDFRFETEKANDSTTRAMRKD